MRFGAIYKHRKIIMTVMGFFKNNWELILLLLTLSILYYLTTIL